MLLLLLWLLAKFQLYPCMFAIFVIWPYRQECLCFILLSCLLWIRAKMNVPFWYAITSSLEYTVGNFRRWLLVLECNGCRMAGYIGMLKRTHTELQLYLSYASLVWPQCLPIWLTDLFSFLWVGDELLSIEIYDKGNWACKYVEILENVCFFWISFLVLGWIFLDCHDYS